MLSALVAAVLSLPLAFGMSTIYWPVQYPTASSPWYIGGTNVVAWSTGGGTGVQVFDIQLHNANKTVMTGFKPIALRVPMEKFPKSAVYGGEIEVDLDADTPTGDGFSLLFMDTYHGEVYAKSQKFSIYASEPANYQTPDVPVATVTATLSGTPNPTQQWAMTLNGEDPEVTATAAQIAGNAGSGAGV